MESLRAVDVCSLATYTSQWCTKPFLRPAYYWHWKDKDPEIKDKV